MALQPVSGSKGEGMMRDTSAQDVVIDPRGKKPLWLAIAVLVAVALAFVVWKVGSQWVQSDLSVARERLRTGAVTEGVFVRDIPIQGVIVAAVKPTVFAPSAGRVTLAVAAGDVVTAGDVVATVESPELRSNLEQAKAELSAQRTEADRAAIEGRQVDLQNQQAVDLARVAITAAQRELRRAEASWEYKVISRQDLEQAQDEVERAELEYAHRQADAELYRERFDFEQAASELTVRQQALRVAELQRQFDELTVRAPVTGIVGTVSVEDRAAVPADSPILNIVDLTQLELEVPLAQGYADDIAIGMTGTVSYDGDIYAAIVSSISPEVENNTVATRLRFSDLQPQGLRQNQRLTGKIELDRLSNAVQVPRGAWFDSEAGRAAYVIEGDFAVRRRIVAGAASAQSIQILEGLAPGESVVLSNTTGFEGQDRILLTQ
ncbi:MAG: HlyD family efflux transporter periplasmic adaptor subunit [Pseudomonadota bacterium]